MPKLVWLDLETTGLDPNKCPILEVVAAEADLLDPFNIKVIHQSVLWFHPGCVKDQDPYVVDMHTKNGLWKECADEGKAMDAFEVQDALLAVIPWVEDKDERPILAGSSIHFDHDFIKVWMPKLAKRFSHRHYDVSALKLECQSQGMPKFKKAEAHRALADIHESIAHAKACREWLRDHHREEISAIRSSTKSSTT
jgi:oligoribonuclease